MSEMVGNVIVGQSGGPTAVINSSLAGVYYTAKSLGAETVYGMRFGIQGLLDEKYIDLSTVIKNDLDVEILKRTPSAFLGSCRYKLPAADKAPEVYEKIFEVLEKLGVKYFFYIGGNDSMDTIHKLSDYAEEKNSDIRFLGVPKTIDNDLMVTDHTPGFGSAAKYIATSVKEVYRDTVGLSYKRPLVTIMEIMGRNAGWLTGAAALAKDEDCEGADLIYLPEVPFDVEDFLNRVHELLKTQYHVVVAVSEGVKTAEGSYVCELGSADGAVDAFGHKQLTGTASYLASVVSAQIGVKTRAIELSSLQRCGSHIASRADVEEAFAVGGTAARAAAAGTTGHMAILTRVSTNPYACGTDIADVHSISNAEKKVPREWITEDGTGVTKEFVSYVRPLIQGETTPFMVNGLPRHLVIPEE